MLGRCPYASVPVSPLPFHHHHELLTLIVDPEATAPWDPRALEVQQQSIGWTPKDLSFSQHGGVGQESGGQAPGTPTSQHQEFFLPRQVQHLHLKKPDADPPGQINQNGKPLKSPTPCFPFPYMWQSKYHGDCGQIVELQESSQIPENRPIQVRKQVVWLSHQTCAHPRAQRKGLEGFTVILICLSPLTWISMP